MISLVISLAGLGLSALSFWYARKAYGLNKQKEDRQLSRFDVYVIEAARVWNSNDFTVQVSCGITNSSDMPNSILLAELCADFSDQGEAAIRVKYPLVSCGNPKSEQMQDDFPLHFAPREAKRLRLQACLPEQGRPLKSRLLKTTVLLTSGDAQKFLQTVELHSEKSIF